MAALRQNVKYGVCAMRATLHSPTVGQPLLGDKLFKFVAQRGVHECAQLVVIYYTNQKINSHHETFSHPHTPLHALLPPRAVAHDRQRGLCEASDARWGRQVPRSALAWGGVADAAIREGRAEQAAVHAQRRRVARACVATLPQVCLCRLRLSLRVDVRLSARWLGVCAAGHLIAPPVAAASCPYRPLRLRPPAPAPHPANARLQVSAIALEFAQEPRRHVSGECPGCVRASVGP